MDRKSIRAFALRARGEVERERRAYWARLQDGGDARATFDISVALHEHVRRLRPDYPTERERAQDLADHVALKALVDRASRALAVR